MSFKLNFARKKSSALINITGPSGFVVHKSTWFWFFDKGRYDLEHEVFLILNHKNIRYGSWWESWPLQKATWWDKLWWSYRWSGLLDQWYCQRGKCKELLCNRGRPPLSAYFFSFANLHRCLSRHEHALTGLIIPAISSLNLRHF